MSYRYWKRSSRCRIGGDRTRPSLSIGIGQVARFLVLVLAAGMLAGNCPVVEAQDSEPNLESLEERAFKEAAALVAPSVVRIETVGGLDRVGNVLTGTAATTGVIVSSDGEIITSSFNFVSDPASILVTLMDGRRFPARIVSNDRSKMLTLLKVEANGLRPAIAARTSSFRVGQWSIAMGRTYDFKTPNVSVGIVSALHRIWGKAVQTDAKVSPVNYGGPLVDIHGRVIGVLVPLSPDKDDETAGVEWYDSGIGFAIPLQDVYETLDRLRTGEDLHPGLLGITFRVASRYSGQPTIDRVRYNSPAGDAGLQSDDILKELDGKPVSRLAQARQILGTKYAGESVKVSVQRGEETVGAEVTLVAKLEPYEPAFLGVLPARFPDDDPQSPPGVRLRYVFDQGPAAEAGLSADDRIVKFNGDDVEDETSLLDMVGRLRPGDSAIVDFQRNDEPMQANLTLAEVPEEILGRLKTSPIPSAGTAEDQDEPQPTGRITDKLAGFEQSYWAYVPDDYNPRYEYGLMVWVHPGGDTLEGTIYKSFREVCDSRGIILVAPKAQKVNGWTAEEGEFVRSLVEVFESRYNIDANRVFLHGFASGAQFSYQLAFKYRELFRGVVGIAAPPLVRPPENLPQFRLQILMMCGDKDNLFPLVERTTAGLRSMKFPVSFVRIPGHGHQYPGAEQVEQIGIWADQLDRI